MEKRKNFISSAAKLFSTEETNTRHGIGKNAPPFRCLRGQRGNHHGTNNVIVLSFVKISETGRKAVRAKKRYNRD